MMGMGEPLYNFDAVRDALLIVSDGDGIGISKRRITLSTSGVVPNIVRAGAEIGCMLAVSLHAVRDELRNELVPLNRKYPIAELLEACRNYPGVSNAKRITFEYVMLKGVNDSIADAKALVRLLKGIPAKINLIPFNPWPGSKYECSDWEQIEKFSAGRVRRRLCLAGAHAARPRHSRRLRPAQERDREAVRARAHGAARHGDDGLADVAHRPHHRHLLCDHPGQHGGRHRDCHRHARANGTASSGDPVERLFFWGAAFIGARAAPALSACCRWCILIALAEASRFAPLLAQYASPAPGDDAARLLRQRLCAAGLRRIDRHPPPSISRELEIAAAAGAVFGLVYWADRRRAMRGGGAAAATGLCALITPHSPNRAHLPAGHCPRTIRHRR